MAFWPMPQLATFTPDECRAMLATERFGRLVVPGVLPLERPVRYDLDSPDLVVEVDDAEGLARAVGSSTRLEVGRFDRDVRAGWSVVARGVLEPVPTGPDEGNEAARSGGSDQPVTEPSGRRFRLRVGQIRGRFVMSQPLYPPFQLDDGAFV
jgi:hypothetical protein